MSRRAFHSYSDDGEISQREARNVLDVLCVKYGFCLPPLWRSRLERNPPRSVDRFIDTVIRAEGLDPVTYDSRGYRAMREEVRLAFERSRSASEQGHA